MAIRKTEGEKIRALPNKMNCLLHSYHRNTVQCLQSYLLSSQQVLAMLQLQHKHQGDKIKRVSLMSKFSIFQKFNNKPRFCDWIYLKWKLEFHPIFGPELQVLVFQGRNSDRQYTHSDYIKYFKHFHFLTC